MSTTVLSFRIDSGVADELRSMAEQGRLSMSALISQVLKSYVEWDYLSVKAGMIPLQKETVQELVNSKPDAELEKLAARAADGFMDRMLVMTGKNDLESFLNISKIRIAKSGFVFSESIYDNWLQLVVHHGMGHGWSVFFSKYHDRILQKLGYRTEVEVKDDLWVVRIEIAK
jgi:hypothetical protein